MKEGDDSIPEAFILVRACMTDMAAS